MQLFKYEDFNVTIEPEALTLKPFKDVVKSNKDRDMAINELAFIYFYSDSRSDYQYIKDKEARKEAIKEGLGLPKKWDISKTLQVAINFYESFKSESALLLEDMNMVIEKLRESLKDIDFKLLDDKGRPIYTLKDVTSTIKQIPELVSELKKIETVINSELVSSTKMRGNQEKTILDDGINF